MADEALTKTMTPDYKSAHNVPYHRTRVYTWHERLHQAMLWDLGYPAPRAGIPDHTVQNLAPKSGSGAHGKGASTANRADR